MKKFTLLPSLFLGCLLSTAQVPEIVSPDLTFQVRGQSIAVIDTILYFPGYGGDYDSELWRSDGTEAGTYAVMDLNPEGSVNPHTFEVMNNELFFIADSMSVTNQLFKTDGTEEGTEWIANVDDEGMENNYMLTVSGELLYYRTYRPTIGVELWASDGTSEGTGMVKDICENLPSYPHELFDFNGTLIFSAKNCSASGDALYHSDGTSSNTIMIGGNNPAGIISVGDTLYFRNTFEELGNELARSTATPGSIEMVQDIRPGAWGSSIYHLTKVDTLIFFRANHPDYKAELWAYNMNTDVAYLVKDIWPGNNGSSFPDNLISYQGKLIFQAHDGVYGQELWISDGTEEGTKMLKNINVEEGGPPYGHSYPAKFYAAGGLLFFQANDGINGLELWQTDGTEEGTVMVHNIGHTYHGSDPGSFREINGYLYFHAYYNDKYRLYKLKLPEAPLSVQPSIAASSTFRIYPSPAGNELTLASKLHESFKYRIADIQGKEVTGGFSAGRQKFRIDISALNSGIYFFIVEYRDKHKTYKFVKK